MSIINDWLERCSAAQQAGSPWPVASLLRAVVDHADWAVSADHADAHTAAPSGGPPLETMEGLALAAALPSGGTVRLHHAAPGGTPLTLDAEHVSQLQLFVQIRVVEQLLSRLHEGVELSVSKPCARLRDFDDFYVLQRGSLLVLAPDANKRRLVAAFTAQDTLQTFVAAAATSAGEEELVAARLTGVELFGRLAESAEIDGVVFNAAGPTTPVPLLKSVAQHVLEAA